MAYFVKVKVVKKIKCAECKKKFEPNTAHPRKFCSLLCATRQTSRLWERKKRKKLKKLKQTRRG
jgi:hypothetical protein